MKQIFKLMSIAALALVGAMITGCAEDDFINENPQSKDKIVTQTVTVNFDETSTRALTAGGVKTFAVGDKIAIFYKNTSNQSIRVESDALTNSDITNEGKKAKFTFTLTNPKQGGALRIIYPLAMATGSINTGYDFSDIYTIRYSKLNNQNGTLASLGSKNDLCTYDGTLTAEAKVPDPFSLTNQLAVGEFEFYSDNTTEITDNVTDLSISDGTNTYRVKPTIGLDKIYVAMKAVASSATITFYATTPTGTYTKSVTGKELEASHMYPVNVKSMSLWDGDLAKIPLDAIAIDGMTLSGTLARNVKISVADGATVTLDGVTINGTNNYDYQWAGLTCLGDATIILKDGTTNTLKGFYRSYSGLQAGPYNWTNNTNLIIKGTGSLTTSSNGYGTGIGSSEMANCGNIEIQGGTITATGGGSAAGIGSYQNGRCGNITISGGTINATGGQAAAGIGSGQQGYCDNITITGGAVTAIGGSDAAGIGGGYLASCDDIAIANTVTSVSATRGSDPSTYNPNGGPNSIGAGYSTSDPGMISTCGAVTFGGTQVSSGTSYGQMSWSCDDGGTYGGLTLSIAGGTWTLTSTLPKFSVSSTKQVYFSKGNLQATYNGSAWSWAFAAHQYDYIGNAAGNTSINGNGTVSANDVTVDLFGWVGKSNTTWTGAAQYGISNSTDYSSANGYGNNASEALKSDWGATIGAGWRTLTMDEWTWVLGPKSSPEPGANCRTSSTIGGTENARWLKAQINSDATAVKGLIIFPDVFAWNTTSMGTAPTTCNTKADAYTHTLTSAQWTAIEAAGAVFLPTAGYRYRATVSVVGSEGHYWSSSPYTSMDCAYRIKFTTSDLDPAKNGTRSYGLSVRLVHDAN